MSLSLHVRGDGRHVLQPSKIVCVGLNYRDHVAENVVPGGKEVREIPTEPVLFPKTPNVLIGPGQPIQIPAILSRYSFADPRTDHEAELAVVIGREARNLKVEEALQAVAFYTAFNDVTQRNIQKGDASGWWRGKSFDTFGPIGPELVPADQIPDPQTLEIRCRVNGELRQEGNTAQMIFSVAEILAFASANFTLYPGDIVATGTPAGVSPIGAGDTVEVEIGGIGILANPVADERPAT